MTGKNAIAIVRVCGVLAGVAAAVTGWDAEAGWRRRCRATPCCEPVCCERVCCEPVRYETSCCETSCCETSCCETRTVVTACPSRCTTCYDACGRRIECGCGDLVVSYRTVAPASACCDVVTNGSPRRGADAVTLVSAETAQPTQAVRPVATQSILRR